MDNPLISIVVPTYNLEGYIEKCLDSLLNQEYSNVEVIVCDDYSSDNTFNICKRIAGIDKRIVLIRNESNLGVSVARNRALDIARGEYVCFVDGDDILSKDSIKTLFLNFSNSSCVSEGKLIVVSSQNINNDPAENSIKTIDGRLFLSAFLRWKTSLSCCAKLFKKSLIGSLRFVENRKINEDRFFLYQYLVKNLDKQVTSSRKTIYGVFERKGSSGRSGFSEKYKDMYFFSKCILDESIDTAFFEDAVFNDIVTNLMFLKYIIRSDKYDENRVLFNERKYYVLKESKRNNIKLGLRGLELFFLRMGNFFYCIYVKMITKILRRKTY